MLGTKLCYFLVVIELCPLLGLENARLRLQRHYNSGKLRPRSRDQAQGAAKMQLRGILEGQAGPPDCNVGLLNVYILI